MTDLLTERQAAERLNCTVSGLRYWRNAGIGPNFVKMGRLVRYDANALAEFVQQNMRISSAEATVGEALRHAR
jgi:Helix-turn-helix domain